MPKELTYGNHQRKSGAMRIGIVEDEVMFREVFVKICGEIGKCSVDFATGSAREAAEQIRANPPEFLILDLVLNEGDGFGLLATISDLRHGIRVLVVSSYCDPYTVFRVDLARVHGFVNKRTDTIKTVPAALAALQQGRTYFSETFRAARFSLVADTNAFPKQLSTSEQRFVALSGKGLDDGEIAGALKISKRTVQNYRHAILRKLGLRSAASLIEYSTHTGFSRYEAVARMGSHAG